MAHKHNSTPIGLCVLSPSTVLHEKPIALIESAGNIIVVEIQVRFAVWYKSVDGVGCFNGIRRNTRHTWDITEDKTKDRRD